MVRRVRADNVTEDPILDAVLDAWDASPEERADPEFRRLVHKSFTYQMEAFAEALRDFGRAMQVELSKVVKR